VETWEERREREITPPGLVSIIIPKGGPEDPKDGVSGVLLCT